MTDVEWDWLKRWALYSPKNVALKEARTGVEFTYGDLHLMATRLAHALCQRHQIKFGDRVAILAKNHWVFVPLFFALQRLGAVLVPVNFRLTPREISHILGDSSPRLLVHHSEYQGLIQELGLAQELGPISTWPLDGEGGVCAACRPRANETGPDEIKMAGDGQTLAMILYTSGTTGAPKGAMLHRQMLFWNSINTTLRLDLSQQDVHLAFAPFFHTGGWNVLLTPFLHRGAKTILLEKFDVEEILALIPKEKVSILFGVPTMLDMLSRSPQFADTDLRSLRFAIVGGEPMPLELIHLWQNRGIAVRQGYGLTEFGPNVFSLNAEDSARKIGSIGFPNFYIDARVVNESGAELGPDQIGELILRGPMAMQGYFNHPEETRHTIRDGWVHTGDLVRRDSEGYYFVVGRKKDMYISGGENVYPAEVEQVIHSHPSVQEVAVVGVPDEKWGEVGKAFVVLKVGQQPDDSTLLEHCKSQLARFKIPKHIEYLRELPKSDSGKILKRALGTRGATQP